MTIVCAKASTVKMIEIKLCCEWVFHRIWISFANRYKERHRKLRSRKKNTRSCDTHRNSFDRSAHITVVEAAHTWCSAPSFAYLIMNMMYRYFHRKSLTSLTAVCKRTRLYNKIFVNNFVCFFFCYFHTSTVRADAECNYKNLKFKVRHRHRLKLNLMKNSLVELC